MNYDDVLFVDAAHEQAKRLVASGFNTVQLLKDLATYSGEEGIAIQAFGTKAIGEQNIKLFARTVRELVRVYAKAGKGKVCLKSMYLNALWQETSLCAVESLKSCLEAERSENAINQLYTEMAKVGTETSFESRFESVCPRTGEITRKRFIKTVLTDKSGEFTGLLFALHSAGRSISWSVAGHIGSHYFEAGDAYKVKALAYRFYDVEKCIKNASVTDVSKLGKIYELGKAEIAAPIDETPHAIKEDTMFVADINRMQRES